MLHVGCGSATRTNAGPGFQSDEWEEVRLDIDPDARPHIIGSVLDMSMVPDASVDAVFSSHTIEHLYAHEIPIALAEMRRVLKPDGIALTVVPDLQAAARMIAEDKLFETAYISPAGPITPFDIVYSYRGFVGRDRPYMAHHGGFTMTTLIEAFRQAGFPSVAAMCREGGFDLWSLATAVTVEDARLRELAKQFFPA